MSTPFSKEDREPNQNCVQQFAHCGLCLEELPSDQSPAEWARLNFGWTKSGFQLWCERHQANVLHIDFEGHKHPADTTRTPLVKGLK